MKTKEKKGNRGLLVLLVLLLVLAAAGIGTAVWALFFRTVDPILPPDYAPDDSEVYAEEIIDDTEEKNEVAQGGGKVSLTYSNEVVIDLSSKRASLMFMNPKRSSHDVILQIAVQGEVLVQSGLLKAGTQVKQLDVSQESVQRLRPGGYEGTFILFYYDQTTGERAPVNTEIPIHITVRN